MSLAKVRAYIKKKGYKMPIKHLKSTPSSTEDLQNILGCSSERIADCAAVLSKRGVILIVKSSDMKLDSSKFTRFFRIKPLPVPEDEFEKRVGHKIDAVSPVAVNDYVDVYLDESLRRVFSVYISCGNPNYVAEVTLSQLERVADYIDWVNVTSPKKRVKIRKD